MRNPQISRKNKFPRRRTGIRIHIKMTIRKTNLVSRFFLNYGKKKVRMIIGPIKSKAGFHMTQSSVNKRIKSRIYASSDKSLDDFKE